LNDHLVQILPDDQFRFVCSPGVACFNECCRDLNQFLYPYDILRLKKGLGLSSGEFLERYTIPHIGPESGLPIVALKAADASGLTCPFVTEKGCRVYPDRPSSCRIYPLMRAISCNRETGKVTERFMLLNEPHCLGFNEPKEQTVRQWIKEQGVETDNPINDKLLEIISLKSRLRPGPLELKSRRLFFLALYDLDNFRNQFFNSRRLDNLDVAPHELASAETDDTALLEVAMEWMKQVLFKS
jgi:Fe-S-cluster containining protein